MALYAAFYAFRIHVERKVRHRPYSSQLSIPSDVFALAERAVEKSHHSAPNAMPKTIQDTPNVVMLTPDQSPNGEVSQHTHRPS
jgi:hypothetical protein